MKINLTALFFIVSALTLSTQTAQASEKSTTSQNMITAKRTIDSITIDGRADEASWQQASWQPLANLILGAPYNEQDFNGRFKLTWDQGQLYLLVEIVDDVLFDQHANPLHLYWDDDCLEIFIDEDASGGNHQFNHNAFAYHIALDNQVADLAANNKDGSMNPVLLNDHINSVWQRSSTKPNKVIWEVALQVFDDRFDHTLDSNLASQQPVTLTVGKTLGFMLAYCDNDGSAERENFIGSADITAVNGSKNLGYITADVFQKLILIK